jgi:hypothetical protein
LGVLLTVRFKGVQLDINLNWSRWSQINQIGSFELPNLTWHLPHANSMIFNSDKT